MNRKIYVLFLMLLSTSLRADYRFNMNVGSDFNYARYNLDNVAPLGGYLAGVHFDFDYKKPCYLYTGVQFDGRWNAGLICSNIKSCDPCYVGGNMRAEVADYITDWRLGYHWVNTEETWSVTPFVGVGFQHLSFELEPSIMRYRYYQVFVPIGLDFYYHMRCNNITLGLRGNYRAGAYNRLKVTTPCVTDTDDECELTTNSTCCPQSKCGCDDKIKLKYSHGFHIDTPLIFRYREGCCVSVDLSFIPFFDWNRFARTCEKNFNDIVIPITANKRWYLGFTLGIGINF